MSRTLVPNSTQTPDAIFDQWLPLLTPIETKIVFFIVRKTFGWGKKHDKLGLTQIVTGAGLSAASVRRACATLEAVGVLLIRHAPGGNTVNDYALNLNNADAVEARLKARANSSDLSQGDTGIREIPVSGRRKTSISVTQVPISGRDRQETLLETKKQVPPNPHGGDGGKSKDRSSRTAKNLPDHAPEAFAKFYDHDYPNKENRADAVRAWDQQKPTEAEIEKITSLCLKIPRLNEEEKAHMAAPGVWIRNRRWENDVPFKGLNVYRDSLRRQGSSNAGNVSIPPPKRSDLYFDEPYVPLHMRGQAH